MLREPLGPLEGYRWVQYGGGVLGLAVLGVGALVWRLRPSVPRRAFRQAPVDDVRVALPLLTDHLRPGLRLVDVGPAVTACAAARRHHHAGPGDDFWRLLHASGITGRRLAPEDDAALPDEGVGLTDLLQDPTRLPGRAAAHDLEAFTAKVERCAPAWVAFHGKAAAAAYAGFAGHRPPPLGRTPWAVAGSCAFVLPSASGANRRVSYDGRPTRLEWWAELALLLP